MDDVSANFIADVFRALPIECFRKIAPPYVSSVFSGSRFAQESLRFARRFEEEHHWRMLLVQLLPNGTYRYGALEQNDGSQRLDVMDVAKFFDLGNLQFDSIAFRYVDYVEDTYCKDGAQKWEISHNYSDYLYLCDDFPTHKWSIAANEAELRRIIEACTVPGCVLAMIHIPEFPARCVLKPICSRISKLLCDLVGHTRDGHYSGKVHADNFEKFLWAVITRGKLETLILRSVEVNDPIVVSALIKQCKEVEIVESGVFPGCNRDRKFVPLTEMKARVSELL